MIRWVRVLLLGLMLPGAALVALSGCGRFNMYDQPRVEPLEENAVYENAGYGSRISPPNTVARDQLFEDEHLHTGRVEGELVDSFPFPIRIAEMERGQQRFNIFCSNCHGFDGDGKGIVMRRGLNKPPPRSLHDPRLVLNEPEGHVFEVITRGFGAMPSLASQIKVEDRWKIVAYVRALQLSQGSTRQNTPDEALSKLEELPQ